MKRHALGDEMRLLMTSLAKKRKTGDIKCVLLEYLWNGFMKGLMFFLNEMSDKALDKNKSTLSLSKCVKC